MTQKWRWKLIHTPHQMSSSTTFSPVARPNRSFNADANTGHAFGIFMACVGALRTCGAPAPLTLVVRGRYATANEARVDERYVLGRDAPSNISFERKLLRSFAHSCFRALSCAPTQRGFRSTRASLAMQSRNRTNAYTVVSSVRLRYANRTYCFDCTGYRCNGLC